MASRDKHCTATSCRIPASFCHAHHKQPWSRGGRTTVRDGTMLCPRHHRMVHDPRYTTDYRDDGKTCITRTRRRRT
ncbi:HNH endonuclease [Nocardioides caldifontis]|uniref:HNH endonuclease n=1 Tax=Nocardioides caldifontis TaxID=2588938 RepID=UPI003B8450CD